MRFRSRRSSSGESPRTSSQTLSKFVVMSSASRRHSNRRADRRASPQNAARGTTCFTAERRAAAPLNHRNLCHVYDVGEINGTPYLTMLFVQGRPLADALDEFTAQPRRALDLVKTLAGAMAVAHAANVLHRDLKPSNILLDV